MQKEYKWFDSDSACDKDCPGKREKFVELHVLNHLEFMKNNRIVLGTLLAGLMCLAVSPARALTEKEVTTLNKAITGAPVADLANKAAELVKKAAKKEKEATALAVVRAAVAKSPANVVTVVSSVIKAAPATAPAVAAAAAKLLPDQIEAIAVAAALAAPDLADKIVAALAEVDPKSEEKIARAVIVAVPRAEASIRQRTASDKDANHQGESYTRSGTRLDNSPFPLNPVRIYAAPGKDPGRP
jgi:hypothetical protein